MSIKAIIFDYDYTLGDRSTAAFHKYSDFVAQIFPKLASDSYEFDAIVYDLLQWDMHGNFDKKFVIEQFNKKYQQNFSLEAVNKWWNDDFYKYSILYPDTIPVLKLLKQEYQLGIISNGNSIGQKKKIATVGLEPYFQEILIGGDFAGGKPQPLIFETMLAKLKVKPQEAIYVGDLFAVDVIGAARVKMHPVLINRTEKVLSNSNVIIIKDLWELYDKLKNSQII